MNEQAIQVLDEFLNGELGYAELERVWTAAAEVAPNARAELRSHLESLLQSNRLPGEIYAGLMRLVSDDTVQQFRAAPDADSDAVSAGGSDSEKEIDAGDATVARDAGPDADATRIKQPAERDEQLTVDNFQTSPLSFEESTQAKTRSGTERIAPPPEPSSATERIAPPPGASSATERIVPPDAAAETVQNAPPPTPTREVDRNAPTVGKHAPRPAGAEDETQEDGARRTAGADSRPSAADWAHPEKWAASHSGPVGPGSVLAGKYELLSVLGQGGMGVVYRALNRSYQLAEDRKPYVAIKVLSGEFGKHPQAVMALHREARKSQTLAHPNIINVRDFDHDGTTVFMSMELLEGKTLSRTIADQRPRGLAPDVALRIVRGIAAALSYAHEKGIVHSDLKPGNIFVTDEGETKVLDFGIARAVPSSLRSDGDKTVFNVSELGALTPAYASLEMLDGHLPIPADDVFALGLVAYELLVGRHPFDKRPVDKVERVPAKLPPIRGLAGRERRAILRALAFERADRQADAGVFLKEFEGLGRFRRIAYAATAAAAVLAAVAGYQGYRSTLALPDVPFSSLSAPLQQQVLDANVEGQRALGFGALNDAFQYYSAAFGIHRNNPGAIQGLERVADSFLAATATADPRDQRDVMQLLYCQEYLRRYKPVVEACDTVLGASECTVQSLECPLDDAQ